MIKNLNILFASLVISEYNMKLLHWGVTGKDFDVCHNTASEYEEKFGEFLDEVAEIILMHHDTVPSLIECIDILKESEDEYLMLGVNTGSIEFDYKHFFEYVDMMLFRMIRIYEAIAMDKGTEYQVEDCVMSKLHEQQYWMSKEMLYKNRRRRNN